MQLWSNLIFLYGDTTTNIHGKCACKYSIFLLVDWRDFVNMLPVWSEEGTCPWFSAVPFVGLQGTSGKPGPRGQRGPTVSLSQQTPVAVQMAILAPECNGEVLPSNAPAMRGKPATVLHLNSMLLFPGPSRREGTKRSNGKSWTQGVCFTPLPFPYVKIASVSKLFLFFP